MTAPTDAELRTGLMRALAGVGLELGGVVERLPSDYRTSFPIEEVRVELKGRGEVTLAFKQLDWEGLGPGAQLAKPRFLHDPEREPEVYRALVPRAPVGPAEFFGSVLEGDRHWLFVEWVAGRELFQVGERELWEEAARWLARFHVALAPQLEPVRSEARLLDHDAAFYRRWIERAKEFGHEVSSLAVRHEQAVEALVAQPRTVVHGEFYASNVLVASGFEHTPAGPKSGARVAPVDWELAAVGTGLSDLAALVSGWPAPDRDALVAAYAGEPGVPKFDDRDLGFARLQVAVQWLGWAPPQWEPPAGQRHDWLGEAIALAEELER